MTARYPLAALTAAMGHPSKHEACERLAVSGTAWATYRSQGLTVEQADRLAVRAGLHPAEVWSSWFADDQAAEEERAEGRRARDRAYARRWRQANAERHAAYLAAYRRANRERARRYRRAYYRLHRDRELARQRAYDQARREGIA